MWMALTIPENGKMTVTRIEKLEGRRNRIYVDDASAFVLYSGELRKLGLEEGEDIPRETYDYVMKELLVKRARLRALHVLERRERTRSQLAEKLRQGEYPPEIIENALDYVEGYGYVDDYRYSVQFVRCGCQSKSRRRLILDLCHRGVDRDVAEQAYEDVCQDVDVEKIQSGLLDRLVEKKLGSLEEPTQREWEKLWRSLAAKGFDPEEIRAAIRRWKEVRPNGC